MQDVKSGQLVQIDSPKWTIYCHTHIKSGRRYIGLTRQTWRTRWNRHVSQALSHKSGWGHFQNAIRKYGKYAFTHEELAQCSSLEDANATERTVIEQYDTRNSQFGFNHALGGLHVPHPIRKNPWNDPEYRKKQIPRLIAITNTPQARAANKASLNTPESKARRSSISIAALNTAKSKIKRSLVHTGKSHSPETILKITKINRNRPMTAMMLAAYVRRTEVAIERSKTATHWVCKTHGRISIDDCYKRLQKNGWILFSCKECAKHQKKNKVHQKEYMHNYYMNKKLNE